MTARWDGGQTSWLHMGAVCRGTDVRDFPQGQELCSPGRAFTLHIQVYSARIIWWHNKARCEPKPLSCQHNLLPVPGNQVHLCWNDTCLNPLCYPKSMTPVSLPGQDNSSAHSIWELLGHFQSPGTAVPTDILMFCGIIYRWNIQGQGQGRCWEDNRHSRTTCWIYAAPWHSLIWSECWGAEYLWAEHESSQVKQPFLADRIYRPVFALQESNKAVPEEHRFTGSSSSSWELLAGCGCAFQELSPDQLLRAKSQLLSARIKSKTGFKIEPECAFHQQRKPGWEMWKTLTRTDFMMIIYDQWNRKVFPSANHHQPSQVKQKC